MVRRGASNGRTKRDSGPVQKRRMPPRDHAARLNGPYCASRRAIPRVSTSPLLGDPGLQEAAGLEGEVVVGQRGRQLLGRYVEHVDAEGLEQVGGGTSSGEGLLGRGSGVPLVEALAGFRHPF